MSLAESNMYDWRVKALLNWIDQNKIDGKLEMEKLAAAGHLDQYHYLGLEANNEVIDILGLSASSTILDVGCGIGGPARYIAWKSGATIMGIDIQNDLVECGNSVSELVGLQSQVSLVAGDVVTYPWETNSFDAFISLLVILHIEDRTGLFASLFAPVKPGGAFLIEDMVALEPFGAEETRIAQTVIGAPNLPSVETYRRQLETAGWVDIEFEFLTKEWTQWCINRSDQYVESREKQVSLHGETIFNQRCVFYADVKKLFVSNKLGGVRITGRKPTQIETALRRHRVKGESKQVGQKFILEL